MRMGSLLPCSCFLLRDAQYIRIRTLHSSFSHPIQYPPNYTFLHRPPDTEAQPPPTPSPRSLPVIQRIASDPATEANGKQGRQLRTQRAGIGRRMEIVYSASASLDRLGCESWLDCDELHLRGCWLSISFLSMRCTLYTLRVCRRQRTLLCDQPASSLGLCAKPRERSFARNF